MIANITKATNYSSIIEYHEEKVLEGKASILFDGTYSINGEIINEFDEHFKLFEKESMKNKVAHISISLPIGEHLDDDKFLKITNEYLKKMGYENCPFVIYRHFDKSHDHLHIVASTIDLEGKKVIEYNDFKRSEKASREIEKKYNLKVTEYNNQALRANLTEINFRKYYMHSAIKKASHGYNTKSYIDSFLTDKEKKNIFKKDGLTQKQIQSILGKDKFDTLYNYLHQKGYFNTLYKDEIAFKLDEILKNSPTLKDYVKGCKKNNIYARVMYNKDQKPYLKYGLIDQKIYFKETNFSSRFRFSNIMQSMGYNEESGKQNLSQAEQYGYIADTLKSGLDGVGSFEKFSEYLGKRGVEIILDENKNGPYNMRFKDCKASTPLIFDCNDFDLNYKDIISKFDEPIVNITGSFDTQVYELFNFQQEGRILADMTFTGSNAKMPEEEDYDLSKRKKKKKGISR